MPNRAFIWLWILLILSVGCASTNVPQNLDRLDTMIDQAEESSAREYAAYHFHRATVFRDRARLEVARANYGVAEVYLGIVEASITEAMDVTEQRKELERRRNQRQDAKVESSPPAVGGSEKFAP